jgi:hypothetical protein
LLKFDVYFLISKSTLIVFSVCPISLNNTSFSVMVIFTLAENIF